MFNIKECAQKIKEERKKRYLDVYEPVIPSQHNKIIKLVMDNKISLEEATLTLLKKEVKHIIINKILMDYEDLKERPQEVWVQPPKNLKWYPAKNKKAYNTFKKFYHDVMNDLNKKGAISEKTMTLLKNESKK